MWEMSLALFTIKAEKEDIFECIYITWTTRPSRHPQCDHLSQLVVAEVQVD